MRSILFAGAALAAVAHLGLGGAADAQETERWTVEGRAGAAVAADDLADADPGTGFGFEVSVAYRMLPHLLAYAGWDWTRFTADELLGAPDPDIEETGYAFGLRFEHPLGDGLPLLRVRGGGTYSHIEVEDGEGELVADTGHGLGWEVGAGVVVPLGEVWAVTPGVRYRSLTRDLELLQGVQDDAELNVIRLEVGLARSF